MYTLLQQFSSFDSVWMPMVATSDTYIESKIQERLSYQFCFFMSKCVYIFLGYSVYVRTEDRWAKGIRWEDVSQAGVEIAMNLQVL